MASQIFKSSFYSFYSSLFSVLIVITGFQCANACGSGGGGSNSGTGGSGNTGNGPDGNSGNNGNPDINSALGGTSQLVGPMNGNGGGAINQANDLICCDFDESCRWHNEPGIEGAPESDEFDFGIAEGQPSSSKSNLYFGTKELPESTWLLTGSSKKASKTDAALLISDEVPCQEGDGTISFNYWMTPGTELRACTRRPNDGKNFISCSAFVKRNKAPGPAILSGIRGEGSEPFEIVIEARKFDYKLGKNEGGLILLDCLEYDATLCGGSDTTPRETTPRGGEGTTFEPPPTGGADFEACKTMSCTFDSNNCELSGSGFERESKQKVGNIHTGIRRLNDGPYALFRGPESGAHILSQPFKLESDHILRFCKYRATAETFLTVTGLHATGPEILHEDGRIKLKPHVWDCIEAPLKSGDYQGIDFAVTGDAIERLNVAYMGIDDIRLLDKSSGQPLC